MSEETLEQDGRPEQADGAGRGVAALFLALVALALFSVAYSYLRTCAGDLVWTASKAVLNTYEIAKIAALFLFMAALLRFAGLVLRIEKATWRFAINMGFFYVLMDRLFREFVEIGELPEWIATYLLFWAVTHFEAKFAFKRTLVFAAGVAFLFHLTQTVIPLAFDQSETAGAACNLGEAARILIL